MCAFARSTQINSLCKITRNQGFMAHLINLSAMICLICRICQRVRSVRPICEAVGVRSVRPICEAVGGRARPLTRKSCDLSDSHGLPWPPTASQIGPTLWTPTASQIGLTDRPHRSDSHSLPRPPTASHGLPDWPHRSRLSDWLRQIT